MSTLKWAAKTVYSTGAVMREHNYCSYFSVTINNETNLNEMMMERMI